MRGLVRQRPAVLAWVTVLIVMNLLGPLFFLDRIEARVVLVVFLVAGTLMGLLTARAGFTRLLGLGHFVWFPLLAWLVPRVDQFPAHEPYGLWVRGLIVVNALSLAIDVVDVIRYVRGEREETVAGLGERG